MVFTVDNRSKLFHYTLPMHKSQSAPRRSTLFVAPKKKKKKKRKKKKIHTYLLRERETSVEERREGREVGKVFDIPFKSGWADQSGALRTRYLPRPPGYPLRGRELITEWKLGSWLGGSVGLSLLKISFDNVRPTIPHPPNWVSCNATYTRFWINSTIYISIYMWNMDRRYKKKFSLHR